MSFLRKNLQYVNTLECNSPQQTRLSCVCHFLSSSLYLPYISFCITTQWVCLSIDKLFSWIHCINKIKVDAYFICSFRSFFSPLLFCHMTRASTDYRKLWWNKMGFLSVFLPFLHMFTSLFMSPFHVNFKFSCSFEMSMQFSLWRCVLRNFFFSFLFSVEISKIVTIREKEQILFCFMVLLFLFVCSQRHSE